MSLTSNHNATQQVFERVFARPVAAPDIQQGQLVHLLWQAPEQGERLVQFYLNGQLAGSSLSITRRDAWLVIDHTQHIEVELLAVDPTSATVDLASELTGLTPATQPTAAIAVLRDLSLPLDTTLHVSVDGGLTDRVPLFSTGDARGGFGAVFGEGGFGYDTSIGPGLGQGELGYGPLGSGGEPLRWRGEALSVGPHTLDLLLEDRAGLPAAERTSQQITIDRLPDAPMAVELTSALHLTWT